MHTHSETFFYMIVKAGFFLYINIESFSPLQFVFFTGGIVFLTLIVNGSTTQFVLRLLDMDKLSAAKVRI